ncbi:phage Gp37/Gp68 family protein [Bacillus sp. V5-8f]|nr:phage Gp37/Gp68 family protein [Bacillus sp. V5-8f]
MASEWIRIIRDQCKEQKVAFFLNNGVGYKNTDLEDSWIMNLR